MLMVEVTAAIPSSVDERRQAAREVLRLCPDDAVALKLLDDLERSSVIAGSFVITASPGSSVSASSAADGQAG
jgi:hypothetical protein